MEICDGASEVKNLLNRMDGRTAGPDLLLESMEVHKMLEGYFTDEQKQRIVDRRESLGTEKDSSLRGENKEAVSAHVGGAMGFDPRRLTAVVTYVEEARAIRDDRSG